MTNAEFFIKNGMSFSNLICYEEGDRFLITRGGRVLADMELKDDCGDCDYLQEWLDQMKELGIIPEIVTIKPNQVLVIYYNDENLDASDLLDLVHMLAEKLPDWASIAVLPNPNLLRCLTKEQLKQYIDNLQILVDLADANCENCQNWRPSVDFDHGYCVLQVADTGITMPGHVCENWKGKVDNEQ